MRVVFCVVSLCVSTLVAAQEATFQCNSGDGCRQMTASERAQIRQLMARVEKEANPKLSGRFSLIQKQSATRENDWTQPNQPPAFSSACWNFNSGCFPYSAQAVWAFRDTSVKSHPQLVVPDSVVDIGFSPQSMNPCAIARQGEVARHDPDVVEISSKRDGQHDVYVIAVGSVRCEPFVRKTGMDGLKALDEVTAHPTKRAPPDKLATPVMVQLMVMGPADEIENIRKQITADKLKALLKSAQEQLAKSK